MFCAKKFKERTWAEIDLDALSHNLKQIKTLVKPSTKVMAVVKANAYGHGSLMCAKTLLSAGADYLAVATVEEALELRHAGILAPILILGYIPSAEAEAIISHNITATVYNQDFARVLSGVAQKLNKTCKIHLKLNTGMERIGFQPEDTDALLAVCNLPGLEPEGIFTHLACADEEDSSCVHGQYQKFMAAAEFLRQSGIKLPLRHILNSAGIFDFPEYQLDMVRPGIVLYGYYPSRFIHCERAKLLPVMSLKSRVIHLHTVPAGASVSYGWTYTAKSPILVATVPIGYADGYPRLLSGQGEMLICGKKVPILGRICMDQCMIDVTSVNTTCVGDEITVIGKQGDEEISADAIAKMTNTISYEILCSTGKRVPRLYKKGGDFIGVLNGFDQGELEKIMP
ncbi:MAG: alanine racemase [Clostridia bacterium]|nr:alanine racemase [Clostridia bacterium]